MLPDLSAASKSFSQFVARSEAVVITLSKFDFHACWHEFSVVKSLELVCKREER
jgi:hypothetical protein